MSFEVPEFLIEDSRIKKDTRLMLLSDLHGNSYGKKNESLVIIIDCYKPDAIIMPGDIMSCKSKEAFYGSLGMCKSLTDRYPVYFVNGNHEEYYRREKFGFYKEYMQHLKAFGVHIMSNSSEMFNNTGICFYGLRLSLKSYVKFAGYRFEHLYLHKIFEKIDKRYYNILLSHNPYVVKSKKLPFDLVLSGHMHGGGIRLPKLGAVIGPNLIPFPRLTKGLYEVNGAKLIVSAGLGDHFPMLRINNPRTLVCVDLKSG